MKTQGIVKTILKESERLSVPTNLRVNMFEQELRDMDIYDNGKCPERWREAIAYVNKNGFNSIDVLNKFGERKFCYSLERLEKMVGFYNGVSKLNHDIEYNDIEEDDEDIKEEIELKLPIEYLDTYDNNFLKGLIKWYEKNKKGEILMKDKSMPYGYQGPKKLEIYFHLKDKIKGFSRFFGRYEAEKDKEILYPKAKIYGLPEIFEEDNYHSFGKTFLEIGEVDLEGLQGVSNRRFNYIFRSPPAIFGDIEESLIDLNNFPKNQNIKYKLEERTIKELTLPDSMREVYNEAKKAQEKRLFSDVKIYELTGERLPKKDPVIVGFDVFKNKFPIVYWQGDEGLK